VIRIAAVGDVHVGEDSDERFEPWIESVHAEADVLLLAGDLTRAGFPAEAARLARELAKIRIPIVAVLGNHDYQMDRNEEIGAILTGAGVRVLEGDAVVLPVGSSRLGIAGTKGFGGGFLGACGSEFGEPEMKAFIRHTKRLADTLRSRLLALDADVRVALMHYAPIPDTLEGERREIYPFLGSYLLAEAVDAAKAHFVVHGHAHAGIEIGATPGGIPVRNVARTVIKQPYKIYRIAGGALAHDEYEPARAAETAPARGALRAER
jgi:Icc-related predicted phosphoesterase